MKRTNTFAVRPLSDRNERLLRDLLDASAALWNEVNYERLIRYDDEDRLEDENVWDAPTGTLEGQYKGVLGASTAQQVIRKNSEAWRSFFRLKDKYHDESNTSVTEHPEPPGFRGNKDDTQCDYRFDRWPGNRNPSQRGRDERNTVRNSEGGNRYDDSPEAANNEQQREYKQQMIEAAEYVFDTQ